MRSLRALSLVALTVGSLAIAGCGSDDEESAASTATAPAVTGATPGPSDDPAIGGGTTATGATGADGGSAGPSSGGTTAGDDGAADADDSLPSGGVAPSGGSGSDGRTAGGVQPTIAPGTADTPASAITDDPTLIDLWCEQARQGAYNDQVGDATQLAITVQGSDDTRICELPR